MPTAGACTCWAKRPTLFSESNSLMHPEATRPRHTPRHPLLWGAAMCVAVLAGCATSALQPQAAEAIKVAPPAATAEANLKPAPTLPEPAAPELEEPASPAKDQLSERLEAVRAIERSLQTRPAPAAASPSAPAAGASSPGNGTKP